MKNRLRTLLGSAVNFFRTIGDWFSGANIPQDELPMMSVDPADPDHITDYLGVGA